MASAGSTRKMLLLSKKQRSLQPPVVNTATPTKKRKLKSLLPPVVEPAAPELEAPRTKPRPERKKATKRRKREEAAEVKTPQPEGALAGGAADLAVPRAARTESLTRALTLGDGASAPPSASPRRKRVTAVIIEQLRLTREKHEKDEKKRQEQKRDRDAALERQRGSPGPPDRKRSVSILPPPPFRLPLLNVPVRPFNEANASPLDPSGTPTLLHPGPTRLASPAAPPIRPATLSQPSPTADHPPFMPIPPPKAEERPVSSPGVARESITRSPVVAEASSVSSSAETEEPFMRTLTVTAESPPARREAARAEELNSSPIKRCSMSPQRPALPAFVAHREASTEDASGGCSFSPSPVSSPAKRVTFSDNLSYKSYSDAEVSEAAAPEPETKASRGRSILRASSPMPAPVGEVVPRSNPATDAFWDQGVFVQLPLRPMPDAARLQGLIEIARACLTALANPALGRKFEVYGTLRACLSATETIFPAEPLLARPKCEGQFRFLYAVVTGGVAALAGHPTRADATRFGELAGYMQRDLETPTERAERQGTLPEPTVESPFVTRTSAQILRLAEHLLGYADFQPLFGIARATWLYRLACSAIARPSVPKSLVACHAAVIKGFLASPKGTTLHAALTGALQEETLGAVMGMRFFPSNSLLWEKLTLWRRIAARCGPAMARAADTWVPYVVLNVVAMVGSADLSPKLTSGAVLLLLEIARSLACERVQRAVATMLSSAPHFQSFFSDPGEGPIQTPPSRHPHPDTPTQTPSAPATALEYIHGALGAALQRSQHKSVMDVWLALTLLQGPHLLRFGDAAPLSTWLDIHKQCFNLPSDEAKLLALRAWRGVVHVVCANHAARPQAADAACTKLMLHPFTGLSVNFRKHEDAHTAAMAEALHHLFCAIYYSLFNTRADPDRFFGPVVARVLGDFYFNPNSLCRAQHQWGVAVVCRLLRGSVGTFNALRGLAAEPVVTEELAGLPARWMQQHPQEVWGLVRVAVEALTVEGLDPDAAVALLVAYLRVPGAEWPQTDERAVRLGKETSPRIGSGVPARVHAATKFIVDRLEAPLALAHLYKVVQLLADALGLPALLGPGDNCIDVLLGSLPSGDSRLPRLVQYIYDMLGAKGLVFVADILRKYPAIRSFCYELFQARLRVRVGVTECVTFGRLLSDAPPEAFGLVEAVMGLLLTLPGPAAVPLLRALAADQWHAPTLCRALLACSKRDVPVAHSFAVELIRVRCALAVFTSLVRFLIFHQLDLYLVATRATVVATTVQHRHTPLAPEWRHYVAGLPARSTEFWCLHVATMAEYDFDLLESTATVPPTPGEAEEKSAEGLREMPTSPSASKVETVELETVELKAVELETVELETVELERLELKAVELEKLEIVDVAHASREEKGVETGLDAKGIDMKRNMTEDPISKVPRPTEFAEEKGLTKVIDEKLEMEMPVGEGFQHLKENFDLVESQPDHRSENDTGRGDMKTACGTEPSVPLQQPDGPCSAVCSPTSVAQTPVPLSGRRGDAVLARTRRLEALLAETVRLVEALGLVSPQRFQGLDDHEKARIRQALYQILQSMEGHPPPPQPHGSV